MIKQDTKKHENKIITNNFIDNDIAIIGIGAKLPLSENIEDFWNQLIHNKNFVIDFPKERQKDIVPYLERTNSINKDVKFMKAAYLKSIDKFDYEFFDIPYKEACLIDPKQRLFLETTFEALENAGYGGGKLSHSKTGVYVGYSDSQKYQEMISKMEPESLVLSVAGNIESIIASRISYLFDFRGPSMLVDTACSSSLVALHLACEAIRNGDCDYAIAGTVKIHLVPIENEVKLGIEAEDSVTKTFDSSSTGTGSGEGVISILLKKASSAYRDKDNIYAVIKSTSINQDGSSIGITAPNLEAQEELLINAWKKAGVQPNQIGYVEAHGTGTRLGDPIEVSALSNAWRRYSNEKQFCGIGSIKSNIGHLDHAAGLAGVLKVVLAIRNGEIPATLHFTKENEEIDFIETPFYMTDVNQHWNQRLNKRIGCVSSFGLSGTNAHCVIQGWESKIDKNPEQNNILFLSAKSVTALHELIDRHWKFLNSNQQVNLEDMCYTQAIGRGHYGYRTAIVFNGRQKLLELLWEIKSGIQVCENKLIVGDKENLKIGRLIEIGKRYVKGEDIDYLEVFEGLDCSKISIPTYPLKDSRCWINNNKINNMETSQTRYSALVDKHLVSSYNQDVYIVTLSMDRWIVNEHRIFDKAFPPGTVYLEMVKEIAINYFGECAVEFEDVIFVQTPEIEENESLELQIVVTYKEDTLNFKVMGKKKEWERYAEGTVTAKPKSQEPRYVSMDEIRKNCSKKLEEIVGKESRKVTNGNHFGIRYETMKREITVGKGEALQRVMLSPQFKDDLKQMYFHPFMLDVAMTPIDSNALKSFFIPVSYKSFILFDKLPEVFYSHSIYDTSDEKSEVIKFNVELLDVSGKVLGEIKNYIVKKVEQKQQEYQYQITWKSVSKQEVTTNDKRPIVLIGENKNYISKLGLILAKRGLDIHTFICDETKANYDDVWERFEKFESVKIIDCFSIGKEFDFEIIEHDKLEMLITHLKKLVSSLVLTYERKNVELILLSNYAYKINKNDKLVNPIVAAYVNYAKVINQEYSSLKCRSIDVDEFTDENTLCDELLCSENLYAVAYRNQQRFQEQLGLASKLDTYVHPSIVENGVYVITGGYGGIGLEIAQSISKNNKIVLVLISRNPIEDKDREKIKILENLSRNVIELKHYYLDITDTKEVQQVFHDVRITYGKINGVIHSAGVPGGRYILDESEEDFYEVVKAKTIGLWNIHNATKTDKLDFLVLQSSVNTVLPNYGQASYIAANAFMDAVAQLRNDMGMRTISIKWNAWNVGMAARNEQKEGIFHTLEKSTAANLFEKLISLNTDVIIVGVLNKRLMMSTEFTLPFLVDEHILGLLSKKTIKQENSATIKIVDDIETNLYQIWESFFGKEVDKNKSYYELGGDSILATQLLNEIDSVYPNVIDIGDIFTYKTYNQMLNYMKEKMGNKQEEKEKIVNETEDSLDSILDRLQRGELTPEEAAKL